MKTLKLNRLNLWNNKTIWFTHPTSFDWKNTTSSPGQPTLGQYGLRIIIGKRFKFFPCIFAHLLHVSTWPFPFSDFQHQLVAPCIQRIIKWTQNINEFCLFNLLRVWFSMALPPFSCSSDTRVYCRLVYYKLAQKIEKKSFDFLESEAAFVSKLKS